MMKHHGILKVLVIDGIHVLVTEDTDIELEDEDGKLMVGDEVRVKGEVRALFAEEIVVKD